MSTEANKEIARRWNEEVINQRKLDAIDQFLHPNYVGYPDTHGLAAARAGFTQWIESTPDLHLQIEDQIAEGDKVVTRWTIRQGGKTYAGVSIYRIEDGKIIEDWNHWTETPAT